MPRTIRDEKTILEEKKLLRTRKIIKALIIFTASLIFVFGLLALCWHFFKNTFASKSSDTSTDFTSHSDSSTSYRIICGKDATSGDFLVKPVISCQLENVYEIIKQMYAQKLPSNATLYAMTVQKIAKEEHAFRVFDDTGKIYYNDPKIGAAIDKMAISKDGLVVIYHWSFLNQEERQNEHKLTILKRSTLSQNFDRLDVKEFKHKSQWDQLEIALSKTIPGCYFFTISVGSELKIYKLLDNKTEEIKTIPKTESFCFCGDYLVVDPQEASHQDDKSQEGNLQLFDYRSGTFNEIKDKNLDCQNIQTFTGELVCSADRFVTHDGEYFAEGKEKVIFMWDVGVPLQTGNYMPKIYKGLPPKIDDIKGTYFDGEFLMFTDSSKLYIYDEKKTGFSLIKYPTGLKIQPCFDGSHVLMFVDKHISIGKVFRNEEKKNNPVISDQKASNVEDKKSPSS